MEADVNWLLKRHTVKQLAVMKLLQERKAISGCKNAMVRFVADGSRVAERSATWWRIVADWIWVNCTV